jgi:hypothetical protein
MAFSDARNERDRAETGRNSTNHGGDHAGADARNRAAMGTRAPGGFAPGMSSYQPRRAPTTPNSYDMNMHNMWELAKIAGRFMGGPVTTSAGMIGGWGAPDFTGFRGRTPGVGDYDSTNRLGQGLQYRMQQRATGGSPMVRSPSGPGLMYRGG